MANRATWAKRVEDWRASGLTSAVFCEGRGFTAGGLRNAAHLVDRETTPPRPQGRGPTVRVVRVVRSSALTEVARSMEPPATAGIVADQGALVVEVGGARVTVPGGFDRATLTVVLEALGSQRGAA